MTALTMAVTRKAGLPCPRCIGGQLIAFHEGELATCLHCGFVPRPSEVVELYAGRTRRGDTEQSSCFDCGVPVTSRSDQGTPRCRACHEEHVKTPEFRDEIRRLMRGLPS